MPPHPDPHPLADLDERTARLGQEWFAEVRRRQREEAAEEKRRRTRRDSGADGEGGPWDWLFGGDAEAD